MHRVPLPSAGHIFVGTPQKNLDTRGVGMKIAVFRRWQSFEGRYMTSRWRHTNVTPPGVSRTNMITSVR